ncbi:MAG: hypothetical protein ACKO0M_11855, partial [Cyanobium sp.]
MVLGRLLLADPEGGRADRLAKHLQAVGHQVRVQSSYTAVLDDVAQDSPDGLILQAGQDPQDPFRLCSHLRDCGSSLPILLLAHGDHF